MTSMQNIKIFLYIFIAQLFINVTSYSMMNDPDPDGKERIVVREKRVPLEALRVSVPTLDEATRVRVSAQYDADRDVYYVKQEDLDKAQKPLTKSQKKNARKKERKRLAREEASKQTKLSEIPVEVKDAENNNFALERFLTEEQPFDLDNWKRTVLKVEGEDELSEDLHRLSEFTETETSLVPYSGSVPFNGYKACQYRGWTGTCPNEKVHYEGTQNYDGTVEYRHETIKHKCLCSEVTILYEALKKEQERYLALKKMYDQLLKVN